MLLTLLFLKKSSNNSSVVLTPTWHPDFRVSERLPDIKPVRTIFFINGAAVFIAAGLAIYVGYRDVALRTLRHDTATVETELNNNKLASRKAVELFGKFKQQEQAVLGLQQFFSTGKLVVSDFILHLGTVMPYNIRLSSIDYKPAGVVLRGDITGGAEEASTYLNVLREDKVLAEFIESITLTSIARDAGAGRIKFEFALKYKSNLAKNIGGAK